MSENAFNVGDRVAIIDAYGPSAISTVEKVHKNGNFIVNGRPGVQYRQSGSRAGPGRYGDHTRVVRATPEHAAAFALNRARHEARRLLAKAADRFGGQRDTTTTEEVEALVIALRAFVTPKEPS